MTETAKTPTVHQAWAAVMADCKALGKDARNPDQGYMFRGIDGVMNAVGPILRAHGVMVIPTRVHTEHRDVQTSRGKPSREATVTVDYTIYGPGGDSIPGQAPGEAMDSGDKGTPKAMSVALRTFLLQALILPTQETDPDAQSYERANPPPPESQQLPPANETNLAKQEVQKAWAEAHEGVWDVEAMKRAFEEWAALPIADADVDTLRKYAAHLRGE